MRLSLVIPAYNEAAKITRDLRETGQFLSTQPYQSEVIFVDDGSKDATSDVIDAFIQAESYPNVTFRRFRYAENRGKGFAVKYGMVRTNGEFVAFMDAGLCVPLKYLEKGIEAMQLNDVDYAIASRRLPGTKIVRRQPLYRRVGSKVFWYVIQGLMRIRITDSQCGFKIYKGGAGRAIYSLLVTDGFMFDIEALMVARKLGFHGVEFPVEWANDSDTRYHPVWSTLSSFRELMRIRWRTLVLPTPPKVLAEN